MALEKRILSVTISLSQERSPAATNQRFNFNEGGNTVTLPAGLRMSSDIQNAGGRSDGVLNLTIWGMTRSLMNQLGTLGMQINTLPKNPISLKAGTPGKLSAAFLGYIISAEADFNAMPEPSLQIVAHTLGAFAAAPTEATSYAGKTSVADIMASFAQRMGLRFENSGVTNTLSNPVFTGSLRDQARACIKASGILWNNGELGILAIWPRTGSRGGLIPVLAPPPKGAMDGFPKYNAYGVTVRNQYDPTIGSGQKVRVESSILTPGDYVVYSLAHELDSEVPNGRWHTTVSGYNPRLPAPPVR